MNDSNIAPPATQRLVGPADSKEEAKVISVARSLATGPADPSRLSQPWPDCEELKPRYWETFHKAVVETIREDTSRLQAWREALKTQVVTLSCDFSSISMQSDEVQVLSGAASAWKVEQNPWIVWNHSSQHLHFWRNGFLEYANWLLWISPGSGTRLLDSLPFPAMMSASLRDGRDVICSQEMILDLIDAAPAVFGSDGAWTSDHSVAALVLAEAIVDHAEARYRTLQTSTLDSNVLPNGAAIPDVQARLTALVTNELPEWYAVAFRRLVGRPDGTVIGCGFLNYLSRCILCQEGQSGGWSAKDAAHEALAAELNRGGCSVENAVSVWQQSERLAKQVAETPHPRPVISGRTSSKRTDRQGEGARRLYADGVPMLFAAASIVRHSSPSDCDLDALLLWVEALIVGRDPGLVFLSRGSSMSRVTQLVGGLLPNAEDPVAMIIGLYRKLEGQRRRAQFRTRYDGDHDVDLPSVFLLRIALTVAENWRMRLSRADEASAATDLFFWAFEESRRLWLTAALDVEQRAEALVQDCFAFVPITFGDEIGPALARLVPPIANDPHMVCKATLSLLKNGADINRLKRLFLELGTDIDVAVADVQQWADLTGQHDQLPKNFSTLVLDFTPGPSAVGNGQDGRS